MKILGSAIMTILLFASIYGTNATYAPPAAKYPALNNILSVFHITPSIVHPNEIDTAQIEVQNNGNFTLYDVQVDFWNDTTLALHRPDKIDILKPHETKIIRGALSTSSELQIGTTTLFWQIIAKNKTGTVMESTLFQRPLTVEDISKTQEFDYGGGRSLTASPLKQFKEGIPAKDVTCKDSMKSIIKKSDGSSACVKPESVSKLLIRGWAILNLKDFGYNPGRGPGSSESTNNYTGIETIKNQPYYFTTLNDTMTSYHNPAAQMLFHDVVFTFFPHPFSGGPVGSCGQTSFGSDLKFSDGTHELLGVGVPGMPCGQNYTETELSNHKNPKAGLEVYDQKIRLLVSVENQTGRDIVRDKPSDITKSKYKIDPVKEKLAREKQKILVDALLAEEAKYGGFKNRAQHLPWSGIGYDYVDNALEVTILPEYFNADALPKYFEKIRSIVGNEIDIALSPQGYAEPTYVSTDKQTPSALKLSLSTDSAYTNPAQSVGVDILLNNTSSKPLTLTKADNWPRNDLSSGSCSSLPFGIAILKGYYTEQNMTGARSLVIYPNLPCPLPPSIKSYTFEPLSSKATQECDSLFSCPGLADMKSHLEIDGFLDNDSQHHPFNVGTYTIVGGDEWGHLAIQHFTVAYATPLSNSKVD